MAVNSGCDYYSNYNKFKGGFMKFSLGLGVIACLFFAPLAADESSQADMERVTIEIDFWSFQCPELEALKKVVPTKDQKRVSSEEWNQNFLAVLKNTIQLIESKNVGQKNYYISIDAASEETSSN
ncbi:MAG: hypothetical protein LLF94_02250 [Chlamydiales bacterium]|nr:hypothetical protein [Chlamydiales bacterium]